MTVKLGINGFGRIGRLALRAAASRSDVEVTAINGTAEPKVLAHLFQFDSVHGVYPGQVSYTEDKLIIEGREIAVLSDKDPANLPWSQWGADVIIESTGRFTEAEKAKAHFAGGARKVIITAPAKGEDITIVMGINEEKYDAASHHIISNASCTTNCLAPVAKVLHQRFGIHRGLMTTVHSYTNDQKVLDNRHKDLRRARAGAMSIIPTTTGAAKAVSLVLPELAGKLKGMAMRVPTPNVSVVDLVAELDTAVTVEDVNSALKEAADTGMKGILQYTDLPLVSIDFNGNPHSAIVDGLSTMVLEDNMVKVIAWYDNEWGYSMRVVDLAAYIGKRGVDNG
ncbi:MAG: type I glyceraldehyde-3-phosphate dehydrogenase [Clostridiales bacterium]